MPGVLAALGGMTTISFGTENPELALFQSSEISYRGQLVALPADTFDGDVAAGLDGAAARVPVTCTTPVQHYNPMEPHAAIAGCATCHHSRPSCSALMLVVAGWRDDVSVEDLGLGTAELLSLSNGESKSLAKLAELAVRQVPGCAAAHATIWRDGELLRMAASHPDPAELADLEIAAGRGPLLSAAHDGEQLSCPDMLDEKRWPQWAEEALRRGMRSSVYLVRQLPPMTLVLGLFGVRPAVLDADSVPMAQTLARFGGMVFANTLAYGEAQRTATQLKDSVAARAITDQAKGILMHALGCDADEALRYMRRESQKRHIKVTEVAARIIATYGSGRQ